MFDSEDKERVFYLYGFCGLKEKVQLNMLNERSFVTSSVVAATTSSTITQQTYATTKSTQSTGFQFDPTNTFAAETE